MSECLILLTSRLLDIQDIQCCLPKPYQNDVIMRDKLLNAVRETEVCRLAYLKPSPTLHGVISDPQSSVATIPDSDQLRGPTKKLC